MGKLVGAVGIELLDNFKPAAYQKELESIIGANSPKALLEMSGNPHDLSDDESNTEIHREKLPACAVSVGWAGSTAVRFPLHSGVLPGSASRSSLVSVLVYQAIMSSALLTFSLCLHHYKILIIT